MEIEDRLRLGYDRFNRREWETIARGLPEEFEAIDHLDSRRERGSDAMRDIVAANADLAFPDMVMNPVEVLVLPPSGDRLVALVRIATSATGETSGLSLQDEVGHIWTFEHGVPVRFEQFRSWDETRRAAGA